MKISQKFKRNLKSFIEITIGCFLIAFAINLFLAPYNVAPGGFSGLAIVINYLLNFPIGVTMLVLNVPLFLIGLKQLGGMFGAKTLYATVILSVIIDSTSWLKFETDDTLLASIFGGIVLGAGLGLVFRAGSTTGGTDLAARITKNFLPDFPLAKIMFFIDATVIIAAIITFKSYELGLYAIVSLYIAVKVVDIIVEGFRAKGAFIISENTEEIADSIFKRLDRGVTALRGMGMYTKRDKNVLMVVVHTTEVGRLKRMVKNIDENAFIILTDVKEVLGEGFSTGF